MRASQLMLDNNITAISCKKSYDTYKFTVEKMQGFGMLYVALHIVTAELETVNGQFPQFNILLSERYTKHIHPTGSIICTRVGTLIVATVYLQLIQNRYMFRSFTVLQCSHQHCVQPVARDVEVVGYL